MFYNMIKQCTLFDFKAILQKNAEKTQFLHLSVCLFNRIFVPLRTFSYVDYYVRVSEMWWYRVEKNGANWLQSVRESVTKGVPRIGLNVELIQIKN